MRWQLGAHKRPPSLHFGFRQATSVIERNPGQTLVLTPGPPQVPCTPIWQQVKQTVAPPNVQRGLQLTTVYVQRSKKTVMLLCKIAPPRSPAQSQPSRSALWSSCRTV